MAVDLRKRLSLFHVIFFLEGLLTTGSGLFMCLFPSWANQLQSIQSTPASDFNLAQFGSLTLLLGIIGLRVPVMPRVIEALLLGDIVWLLVYVPYIQRNGQWIGGTIFAAGITALLAVARISYLYVARNLHFDVQTKRNV
eukprot:TRINITY_DN16786_c0_g1_i1.p1 TRINITY_DN16786_c0_g1~~TRINITY_DN16786_c0_g1_i1.p1  ORF type:complete len:140 (+),score=5.17 TRINITY_DN16786_c0_g1_i1:32-451(+)